MRLLCELFGHWPGLFSLRRHRGRWTCTCWLCDARLVRGGEGWSNAAP
jgi:hypothetical protein